MVPWGTGDPISSGYLNTLVFLTEKPPPLNVSEGGGSMSLTVFSEEIIDTRIYQYVEGTGMLVLLWNQMERKAYVR